MFVILSKIIIKKLGNTSRNPPGTRNLGLSGAEARLPLRGPLLPEPEKERRKERKKEGRKEGRKEGSKEGRKEETTQRN